jgi:hypothetical protein
MLLCLSTGCRLLGGLLSVRPRYRRWRFWWSVAPVWDWRAPWDWRWRWVIGSPLAAGEIAGVEISTVCSSVGKALGSPFLILGLVLAGCARRDGALLPLHLWVESFRLMEGFSFRRCCFVDVK